MSEQCDIGAASRPMLKQEEELARERGIEMNNRVIGYYAVAVLVNAGSTVGNLTRDQMRDIFTGTAENWKAVGGPDAPIHRCIRDPISGTYLGFRELAMEGKAYATNNSKAFTNYAGIVEAVAGDPYAIGYAGFDVLSKPGVRAVSIGGLAPSVAAVQGSKYPYARALRLCTNKAKEPPLARDFIQFVQSTPGQEILGRMGFVPHP
jgi:phosphate transport system substrate-binding protein